MQWIPMIVGGVILLVLGAGILMLFRSKKHTGKQVVLHKFLLILGLIGTLGFLVPAYITAVSGKSPALPWVFIALSLLAFALVIAYSNCRIWYDNNGFTVRNFWGIERYYKYGDVTGIREGVNENFLYMGKRKVMIDGLSVGKQDFFSQANVKYAEINGRKLPRIRQKSDMFHGHIRNPGEFLFVYILLYVFVFLFAVLVAFLILRDPAADAEHVNVTFSACAREEDDLVLTSVDGDHRGDLL